MDRFLVWESQKNAEEMLEHIGFRETKEYGVLKYRNKHTGEWLNLDRPLYFYKKSVQQGVMFTRSEFSKLMDVIRENSKATKPKDLERVIVEFLKQEATYLDSITAKIAPMDHEELN